MKRRVFLGAAAAGLAVTAWPGWLREAFGDGPACDPKGRPKGGAPSQVEIVAAAFRRANKANKPLLVLVIPSESGAKWQRGGAFGELINAGTDEQIAPFADVEVVCATMADLKTIVPNAIAGEPLMVLVDTRSVPASARAIDRMLPGESYPEGEVSWEQRAAIEDAAVTKRIDALAALLRTSVGAPQGDVAKRAAIVKKKLRDKAPPGTHWARSTGCGHIIEGVEDRMMVACGMGHVPVKSQRFLYFYTLPSSDP